MLPRGVGNQACTEADPPPPVSRITDTSKNITLATTSLRPVKMCDFSVFITFVILLAFLLRAKTDHTWRALNLKELHETV